MTAGDSAAERARTQREKAERLERSAALWDRGAAGEAATAAALGQLGAAWHVVHDVAWPGRQFANIDHVVIGPPGIFVVDSKNWTGDITWSDGVLRQNGRSREPAVLSADNAVAVVRALTSVPSPIHPVLCFARDEAMAGRARNVLLCSTTNIVELLSSRPPRLTVEQVAAVVADLSALRPAGAPGPVAAPPVRTAPRPRQIRAPRAKLALRRSHKAQARRRARQRGGVVQLVVVFSFLAAFYFVPGFQEWVGQSIAGLLSPESAVAPTEAP